MFNFSNEVFYTPEQVAEKLQLSLTTVYSLIKSRQIPAIRLGKSFRITESALVGTLRKRALVIPAIVTDFVARLRKSDLQKRIVDVILFGSYARGEDDAASDVDLLLLHDGMNNDLKQRLLWIEEEVAEWHGYQDELQVMKKSIREWKTLAAHHAGMYRTISTEGVSVWKQ